MDTNGYPFTINDTVKVPSTVATVPVASGDRRVRLPNQPTTTCHSLSRKFAEVDCIIKVYTNKSCMTLNTSETNSNDDVWKSVD